MQNKLHRNIVIDKKRIGSKMRNIKIKGERGKEIQETTILTVLLSLMIGFGSSNLF